MKYITTTDAPLAIGAYSQAIVSQGMVFCSGQIPLDPQSGVMINDNIEVATKQVLANMTAVLKGAGCELSDVVKTSVFLSTMDNFVAMNSIYEAAFNGHKPARSAVAVLGLPKGALVEIECIAVKK